MLKKENILKQEEELLKINAEINMKTKNLLKEVEHFKENNLDIDKLCIALEKPETEVESVCMISPEKDFSLEDYVSKINKETSSLNFTTLVDSNKSNAGEKTFSEKDNRFRQRPIQSAKTSVCSISKTNLGIQNEFSSGLTRHKSDTRLKQGKAIDDFIPESVKGIGQEGMTRFLTAKVKALVDQMQVMQREEKKLTENLKELQAHKDKALEEKERLIQQVNTAKSVLVKYEQQLSSLVAQLQTIQTENGHLKKELETLKKEMRQNKQNSSTNELKLNRTLEEVEKLKATIQQMKQEEKESKENSRKKIEDLTNTLRKVDKQRVELLNGFKKQLLTIDNLKRQKGLIEAAKVLKSAEDDFLNFLDSNPQT